MSQGSFVQIDFTRLSKCYNICEFVNFIVSRHILPTYEENIIKNKEREEVIAHLNELVRVNEQYHQDLVQAAKEFAAQAAQSFEQMVQTDSRSSLTAPDLPASTKKPSLRNKRKKLKKKSSDEESSGQHSELRESTSSTSSSDDMQLVHYALSQVLPIVSSKQIVVAVHCL